MAWIWLGVAIVFVLAEVATVAFFALFCAAGALAAALAAAIGFGLGGQVVAFAAVSLLGMLAVRPFLMRYVAGRRAPQMLSGASSMVGREALVVEPIRGPQQPGHVRISGEDWPALSVDGTALRAGAEVVVVELRQATLVVSAKAKGESK